MPLDAAERDYGPPRRPVRGTASGPGTHQQARTRKGTDREAPVDAAVPDRRINGRFFLYIQILLIHSLLQHRYAAQHRRAYQSPRYSGQPAAPAAVDVWIPCYNEDPQILEACCASLEAQDYGGPLRIFLVDDGSSNQDELQRVYQRYRRLALQPDQHPRWTVIELGRHGGKRKAQDAALRHGEGELVMTIDSDTEIGRASCRERV